MNKILTKPVSWNVERKTLAILSILFIGVLLSAWIYALDLKKTVAASNAVTKVDVGALVEVERMRNVAESQIASSRSFFLLGSSALFDKQKKDKQQLAESLANFEKQYSLPRVPELIKRIEALQLQQQDIFDQAMEFRAKQTESKIVGQFYQSKTSPIRNQINESLDEIVTLHNAELERTRVRAKEAAAGAEFRIPKGMTWLSGALALIFMAMVFLVLRMLSERTRQTAERNRLYEETQRAVQGRDELIAAISYDLKEPLGEISQVATTLPAETAEVVQTSVGTIERIIHDIVDQSKADRASMTLRLDQMALDVILDDARLMLQPLAKQRDVRLQFDSANPPILAFLDRERVMRVLSNLVGNAIKFSPRHSKVVVKVRSDQQFVHISVADSGPGIPEKQLPQIFDNFWQARKTAEQGPGVGLAIVKTIVEAHGGTVRVESHVGHGSTFTFSLPRRRPVGANLGRKPAPTVKYTTRSQSTDELGDGLAH